MIVSYHFKLFSESTDGSLPAWNQLFQVLVPQLLPGSALPRTLTTSFKLCLQVYFGWFTTSLAWFLYFASDHLERQGTLKILFCRGNAGAVSLCLLGVSSTKFCIYFHWFWATEERCSLFRVLVYEVFSDSIKNKREGYDFILKSVLKQSYCKCY